VFFEDEDELNEQEDVSTEQYPWERHMVNALSVTSPHVYYLGSPTALRFINRNPKARQHSIFCQAEILSQHASSHQRGRGLPLDILANSTSVTLPLLLSTVRQRFASECTSTPREQLKAMS
jgi:hypothetical protein